MRAGGALIPPIPGLDQVPYLTNSLMMDVDFLPPHLIVLGGSYIGLEFAQVYRRFGSEVTVIELAPRLIAREDEDVSSAVAEFLKEEGIDVRLDSKSSRSGKTGELHCGEGRIHPSSHVHQGTLHNGLSSPIIVGMNSDTVG